MDGDGLVALVELQDVIDAAEVSENTKGGLSVLAKGLDNAEASDAMGLIGFEGFRFRRSTILYMRLSWHELTTLFQLTADRGAGRGKLPLAGLR